VGGGDRFVALLEVGMREQVEQFVRTGAADDAFGVEPEGFADCFAQDP